MEYERRGPANRTTRTTGSRSAEPINTNRSGVRSGARSGASRTTTSRTATSRTTPTRNTYVRNPYGTDTYGTNSNRTGTSRTATNRSTGNRSTTNRSTGNRTATNRPASARNMAERSPRDKVAARRRRLAKARRKRKRQLLIGMMTIGLLVILAAFTVFAVSRNRHAQVIVKADSNDILQGEEMPELKATATCAERQRNVVLDRETEFTAQDLLDELNSGEGLTVSCDADVTKEGTYPITVELSKDIQDKVDGDWKDILELTISDGTLTVKNSLGEWDGDKFKKYDGTYVTADFVESNGNTYYFDEDGNKVTGEKQVGFYDCVFDDDGKLVSKESQLDPEQPMMALTFDDGPGDRTNELLDVLEKYDAHATFFMQGVNIPGHEDAIQRMAEIGCELGNHSYDHTSLATLDAAGIQKQMSDTNALIEGACGQTATVMRPPYGAVNDTVAANVGMPMILWNIDTLDWKTMNAQATIENVLTTADDGDIVLMHDIHSPSIDAAIELIPKLIENGYQLVTVSEMAEARGITMEAGGTYTDFNR